MKLFIMRRLDRNYGLLTAFLAAYRSLSLNLLQSNITSTLSSLSALGRMGIHHQTAPRAHYRVLEDPSSDCSCGAALVLHPAEVYDNH
jgi:hypothetical protein